MNIGMSIAMAVAGGGKTFYFNPSHFERSKLPFTFGSKCISIGVCGWRSSVGRAADL